MKRGKSLAGRTLCLHIASGDVWAGAEVQVATLLPALNALGATTCAVLFNVGTLRDTLLSRGVETYTLLESEGSIQVIAKLRRMIQTIQPDLIHSHGYKESALANLASLGLGIERVRTIHGVPELRVGGSSSRMRLYDLADRALIWGLGVRGIAVSRELERIERQRRVWRRGISYVANAVPQPLTVAELEPPILAPATRGPILLYVGRLEPIKGPDLLVEAFTRIQIELPEAQLQLVGEGSLRPQLDEMIGRLGLRNAVHLLGESRRIPELMAASDLVVIPSRGEGMPTVLLEALAGGTPVVATRVGAIPDVTENGAYAVLVEPGDPSALATGCLLLLRDLERRTTLSALGKSVIRERFGAERSARDTLAVYEELLSTRGGLRATTR